MKKLITITEEMNLDHIAWEEFSDEEDFETMYKGKCYAVCSATDYPLKTKREDGVHSIYKYRRPIEEPKPEPPLWTHEQLVAFHTENPHAVWTINGTVFDTMTSFAINNLSKAQYSLDLGRSWNSPRGVA